MKPKDNPIPDEKTVLREKLKFVRDQVIPSQAEAAALGVWSHLQVLPEFQKAKGIGAFASIPHEINTYPILEGAISNGKKIYLPKVVKQKTHFDYFPVTDLKNLKPGPYGILEPTEPHNAAWEELDMVLVPGLAFDRHGNRLGFGKGYYDRVLPLLKRSCLVVGLGYSFQIVPHVPTTDKDIPMQAILTEQGFERCKKQ